MKKKVLSIVLAVVISVAMVPFNYTTAYALDSRVEAAINWAINIANDDSHGYSQSNRNGPNYDCSSFVSTAFKNGGFAVSGSLTTSTMADAFVKVGFTKYKKSDVTIQRGDILLNPGSHVELYLGDNKCVAAHNDYDGVSGDGNGKEIEVRTKNYCTFCKQSKYTYVLRYNGSTTNTNTYSFSFNANGGTLGSSGSFTTSYGNDFQILNTTCTRSGYTWSGWNVKRNNDNKWYVAGIGWCSESEISSKGYSKKTYSNYQTCKLDDSWINGISGNGSYTFYAKWYQSRDSKMKAFFSPYGKGADHITAMNASSSSGYAQDYIYVWYILYDENTGDLLNTYTDLEYDVCVHIAKPNGEAYEDTNYQNADANWVGFTPSMSGEYTVTITVSGGATGTTSSKYSVSYNAEVDSSRTSIDLNLSGINSKTSTITVSGGYPGSLGIKYSWDDTTIASASWGSWDCYSIPITVTGNKAGKTNLNISVYENYSGNKEVVKTIKIPVTVTADTYTISYNANGGTGAPSSQTKTYGTTLTLSTTVPTRTGYTFLGWSTSSTATSATYQTGGSFTTNANTTLYAVWKPITYTISYNANGGTGAPSSQTKTYGTALTLSSTVPTRTGYTFQGWATSSAAASAAYSAGDSFTTNANTTLYAVWKMNTTALTANSTNSAIISTGGEMKRYTFTPTTSGKYVIYSTGSEDTKVFLYNASGTELANNDDGGENNNFRLEYNLTAGTAYTYGVKYYSSSKTGTISFKFGNVYTVSYNANGGTGAPSSQSKDYGATLTLSSTKPTRTGYTFLGWSTSSSATSATYSAGGSYTANSGTTLYAVWKMNTVALTANSTNSAVISTGGEMKRYTFTPTTNGKYVIYSTGSDDTKVFLYNSSGTELANNDDGGESNNFRLEYDLVAGTTYTYGVKYYNSSKTGTISFKFGNVYTVSYNANGGTGAPSSQSMDYGATLTLSSSVPTRTGYTFLGWSTSSSATSATYSAGSSFTTNANTTLYAVWKPITYTISYNANGGTGAPSSQTKTHGVTLTLSSTKPTRTGYTFLGWSTSSSATSATYSAGGSFTTNANTTLYAVWKPITYTISYNANGGTGAPSSQTKTHGVTLTFSSTKPTRTGYSFLGWSTNSSATSATYQPGGSFTTNANTTLYAVWKKNVTVGDVNNDGVVDAGDAVLISRYDAGLITLTDAQLQAGDVNCDGVVDAGDAVIISRYDAGFISSLN